MTQTHPLTEAELAGLIERLNKASRYSCEHGCEGRCEVCPAEVEREAATTLKHLIAENARLKAALADVDSVLDEYGIDTVGTGSSPPAKEQARVDRIVGAAIERHHQALTAPKTAGGEHGK